MEYHSKGPRPIHDGKSISNSSMTGVGVIQTTLHRVTSRAWCNDWFREEHGKCSMIDYKIIVVFSYKQYVPVGINSWKEFVREYETEIDNCWFLEDALRSFRTYHLPKHGKILSIGKRFQEINKSWNHHHRTCGEIVL